MVVGDRLVFEAADLAVPEPVVAEGEDLAGDRVLGDAAPAAFSDPLEHRTQRTAAGGDLLRGFGQRPAQRGRSLVGDVTEPGFAVGAADGRREPRPGAQVPGGPKVGDIADLSPFTTPLVNSTVPAASVASATFRPGCRSRGSRQ